MKRLILALLVFAGPVLGAPFLVSDPYPNTAPQPDSFRVGLDSGALINVPTFTNPDGSKQLYYDLGPLGITNGSHQFKVTAVNALWGLESTQTNFTFAKGAPGAPAGLGIRAN